MSDIWQDLNPRQRTYLQALYDVDQAEEADRPRRAAVAWCETHVTELTASRQ
jgi:hypothetical protein